MGREISYVQAITEAMSEEMERDDRVVLLGEDVGRMGGVFGASPGLLERFGPTRVIDTPLSEAWIAGGAVGMAITGLRPIAELQFADCLFNAADEVLVKMSKWRYMHGGQFTVPMVVRLPEGATGGSGPEHSQTPEATLLAHPGSYIVVPSNPADAKGLLKSAIRDDNPVAFFEHKGIYNMRGEVPDGDHLVPIGQANIAREGSDVTVVVWGKMVGLALDSADSLAAEGVSVEVVDTRGLRPLDLDAILQSVGKTGRLVIAQEAPKSGGGASEIAALVAEEALDVLAAPILRVGALDVPIPHNDRLEPLVLPDSAAITSAIRTVLA